MSTLKYNALLDTVITRCLPMLDKNIPFLIAISSSAMDLATIKKGLIKAKSEYTIAGKLNRSIRMVFHNPRHYTTDKNFTGFAISFQTVITKLATAKDI